MTKYNKFWIAIVGAIIQIILVLSTNEGSFGWSDVPGIIVPLATALGVYQIANTPMSTQTRDGQGRFTSE